MQDIKKVLAGKYSAIYFEKTQKILNDSKSNHASILQFTHFQNDDICVCGIEHCIEIIKQIPNLNAKVFARKDGEMVKKGEPILLIEGNYKNYAFIESIIDGLLARESSVCNHCKKILNLISTNQLILMADRGDLYINQPYDGYAAYVAGVRNFTTYKHIDLIKNKSDCKVVGTIPHALIQQHKGNLVETLKNYKSSYPNEPLPALVDYTNDVIGEIKKIAKFFPELASIRIDTSKAMLDKSLTNPKDSGVSKQLVLKARQALDNCGLKQTKIVVSSGFSVDIIKEFIDNKIPADFYGVGKSVLEIDLNITGDLVYLDGKVQSKKGRGLDKKSLGYKKLIQYI